MILRIMFTTITLFIFLQIITTAKGSIPGGLDSSCQRDEDCLIEHSRCHHGKCHCLPYYATYNGTSCLQSTLLGFECLVNEQCSQKVANSSCIGGICRCEQGFLQFRRHTCLTPAKVGEVCYGDSHCRLSDSGTFCDFLIPKLFGRCVCTTPLKQGSNGNCVPPRPLRTPSPITPIRQKPSFVNNHGHVHQKHNHQTLSLLSAAQKPFAASYIRTTTKPQINNFNNYYNNYNNNNNYNNSSIFLSQQPTSTLATTSIFIPTTISYTKPIITTTMKPTAIMTTTVKSKPLITSTTQSSIIKTNNKNNTIIKPNNKLNTTIAKTNTKNNTTKTTTIKPFYKITTNIPFLPTSLDNILPKKTTTIVPSTMRTQIQSQNTLSTTTIATKPKITTTTTQKSFLNKTNTNFNVNKPNLNRRPPLHNKVPIKRPFKPSIASGSLTSFIASPNSHAAIKQAITTTSSSGIIPFGRGEENGIVSLGLPCLNDKQCRAADSASRCMNGVCDCAVKTNSSNGNSCSAKNRGCHPGTFQCLTTGTCISWYFVCDGRRDCPDGSDERCQGNSCPTTAFSCNLSTPNVCVSTAARCNGIRDCPHGEDESNCMDIDKKGCPVGTFRCDSGKCIPGYEFCNAVISCQDASDEGPACTGVLPTTSTSGGFCPFQCANGRCRSSAVACSGRDGCGDGSDEEKCSVCKCPSL